MIDTDDFFNIAIFLTFTIGAIFFGVLYNQAISSSQNKIVDIKLLNEIQTIDCEKKGGGYLSFDKKQGCIIFYPAYNNIRY